MTKINNRMLILTALFSAIIIMMTVIPYTGYISYGGIIEITTLHIVVIVASCFLDLKCSAIVGGVWGVSCMLRAVAFIAAPGFRDFVNPLVSVMPRIVVGLVAYAVFHLLRNKTSLHISVCGMITAVAGSLTNTVLVLSMYMLFADGESSFADLLKLIITTIVSINGAIELALAVVTVSVIVTALRKPYQRFFNKSL